MINMYTVTSTFLFKKKEEKKWKCKKGACGVNNKKIYLSQKYNYLNNHSINYVMIKIWTEV